MCTATGAGKRPQTVLVPGRKRLRTLALRDETAQADSAAKEQVLLIRYDKSLVMCTKHVSPRDAMLLHHF